MRLENLVSVVAAVLAGGFLLMHKGYPALGNAIVLVGGIAIIVLFALFAGRSGESSRERDDEGGGTPLPPPPHGDDGRWGGDGGGGG